MGIDDPFLNVADETLMDLDLDEYPPGTVLLPPEKRRYKSYGQWAEANNLGSNPEHTIFSLEKAGTVAYRGLVAPELISQVAPDDARHLREFLKPLAEQPAGVV